MGHPELLLEGCPEPGAFGTPHGPVRDSFLGLLEGHPLDGVVGPVSFLLAVELLLLFEELVQLGGNRGEAFGQRAGGRSWGPRRQALGCPEGTPWGGLLPRRRGRYSLEVWPWLFLLGVTSSGPEADPSAGAEVILVGTEDAGPGFKQGTCDRGLGDGGSSADGVAVAAAYAFSHVVEFALGGFEVLVHAIPDAGLLAVDVGEQSGDREAPDVALGGGCLCAWRWSSCGSPWSRIASDRQRPSLAGRGW